MTARKGKPLPGELSLTALAKGLGLSPTTVFKQTQRGMPRTLDGAKAWRAKNIDSAFRPPSKKQSVSKGVPQTITEARLQLLVAQEKREREQAEKLRLANEIKRGKLLDADEIVRSLTLICSTMRNALEGLGLQCSLLCPAELKPVIKEAIDNQVRLSLQRMANELGELGGNDKTASEDDSGEV